MEPVQTIHAPFDELSTKSNSYDFVRSFQSISTMHIRNNEKNRIDPLPSMNLSYLFQIHHHLRKKKKHQINYLDYINIQITKKL